MLNKNSLRVSKAIQDLHPDRTRQVVKANSTKRDLISEEEELSNISFRTAKNNSTETLGKYKTKNKFVLFYNSRYKRFEKTATISGNCFCGMGLEDVTFKITVFGDNSIDFEEIGEIKTVSEEDILRYVNILDNANFMVDSKFPEKSTDKEFIFEFVTIDHGREVKLDAFVDVEIANKLNKIREIIFEEENKLVSPAMARLKMLFPDDFSDEEDDEDVDDEDSVEVLAEDIENVVAAIIDENIPVVTTSRFKPAEEIIAPSSFRQHLIEEFQQAKIAQKEELNTQLDFLKNSVNTIYNANKFAYEQINGYKAEILTIESRIDSMDIPVEKNGYFYYVSQSSEAPFFLEEDIKQKLIDRLNHIGVVNTVALIKSLYSFKYTIKIGHLVNNIVTEVTNTAILRDVLHLIRNIDTEDNGIVIITNTSISYEGLLEWGQVSNKLAKVGFDTNDEFNQLCTYVPPPPVATYAPQNFYRTAPRRSLPGDKIVGGDYSVSIEYDSETYEGKYLFAISDPEMSKNYSKYDSISVTITPEEYFLNEGSIYEGIGYCDELLNPLGFFQGSDNAYEYEGENVVEAVNSLLEIGFIWSKDFQFLTENENYNSINESWFLTKGINLQNDI